MSAERDLAEAIHHEIISPESVEYALEVWRDALLLKTWSDADRMRSVLDHVSRSTIDRVLGRRQSEAARTGPWEGPPVAGTNPGDTPASSNGMWGDYQEEDGYPGSLLPRKRGAP